ncbi:hypothetical protein F4779DRAFT_618613 [Xylariaceae sp. FL0662B]|nr:hypothetical protein F4779DRAFT_618613 [Xylariaceae sp. FL0662B]
MNDADKSLALVQQHIEYELRPEYAGEQTYGSFSGPPTPEQDRAWDELLEIHVFESAPEFSERGAAVGLALYPCGHPAS